MIVYLTGFMGSGKTTTGRKLARLAGARFVDIEIGRASCRERV